MIQEGRVISSVKYDVKNKIETKTVFSVENVSLERDTYTAAIRTLVKSEDGKNVSENFIIRCNGSSFFIDMSAYLSEFYLAKDEGMEVNIKGDFLDFPTNMKTGGRLKDGQVVVEMTMEGIPTMSLLYKISDRKVLAQEKIETKAGQFECYKIVYAFQSDMGVMKVHGTVIEWWSKDMVAVKSEHYNASGHLISTSMIESIR